MSYKLRGSSILTDRYLACNCTESAAQKLWEVGEWRIWIAWDLAGVRSGLFFQSTFELHNNRCDGEAQIHHSTATGALCQSFCLPCPPEEIPFEAVSVTEQAKPFHGLVQIRFSKEAELHLSGSVKTRPPVPQPHPCSNEPQTPQAPQVLYHKAGM